MFDYKSDYKDKSVELQDKIKADVSFNDSSNIQIQKKCANNYTSTYIHIN